MVLGEMCLNGCGEGEHRVDQNIALAEACFTPVAEQCRYPRMQALAIFHLGDIYSDEDRYEIACDLDRAEDYFKHVESIASEIEAKDLLSMARSFLHKVKILRGRRYRASEEFRRKRSFDKYSVV